ncbi:aminoglycoside phosphotransferase family protein [Brachybacterium tyrofermentans]|uniref:Aminoglycoside phosphotransferase family protein n=1 Tax=Brachybacterium tyrofermentans TaxID=47848 RepID=A0ABW0FLW3_9MICO|nr:aminoglycoside phosphotransferase family protein [Brachybacterium tyrofermentans]
MTQNANAARLPADVLDWVSSQMGDVVDALDTSWPRETSRVWCVTSSTGRAYVKISPSASDFTQEIGGYSYAKRALPEPERPRLLSTHDGLKALLSSLQPGVVMRGLPLEPAEELSAHTEAGRLLRRWHDHSGAAPVEDRDVARKRVTELADEARACRPSMSELLDPFQVSLLTAAANELPELAERNASVTCHGDFSTRNWLWDRSSMRLGVIDFERTGPGYIVEDMVWLYGALWLTRPSLRRAFFDGYGRALSGHEERLLQLLTVRLGVSYWHTGLTTGRDELVERGRLGMDLLSKHLDPEDRV